MKENKNSMVCKSLNPHICVKEHDDQPGLHAVSDSSRQSVDEYMPVNRIHSGKNVLDSGATFRLFLLERFSWWRKRTSDG